MAFSASGTDYGGFLDQRRLADNQLTQALDAKGKAEKRARVKKSGERSGLKKMGSAVARGIAAYYTLGASEAMGGGKMIDSAMLGTDSEGNAVKNEYGDMVGMASQVGSSMSNKNSKDAALKMARSDARDERIMADLTPEARVQLRLAKGKRFDKNEAAMDDYKELGFMGGLLRKNPDIETGSLVTDSWATKYDESQKRAEEQAKARREKDRLIAEALKEKKKQNLNPNDIPLGGDRHNNYLGRSNIS